MNCALRRRQQKMGEEIAEMKRAQLRQVRDLRRLALAGLTNTELEGLLAPDGGSRQPYRAAWEAAASRSPGGAGVAAEVSREMVEEEMARRRESKLYRMFPDTGPVRRELYPKHLEFFRAGRDHREVAFIAANRCGKSEAGVYQAAVHLTGLYPPWWEGRRFDRPIHAWMISDTNQTTRDILQRKLLGRIAPANKPFSGSGDSMVPGDRVVHVQMKPSTRGAVETALIRHVSGGVSEVTFKSYQQGREAFQGTEQDLVVCDEEPPMEVYAEALMRTMDTTGKGGGLVLLLFTPLNGWSEVVDSFLNPEKGSEDRACVQAGWDDVPHLSAAEKESMLEAIPEYQREARSKGIPRLGSGAIYPIADSEIALDPFLIPPEWQRVYALDVGWECTAALWLAQDPASRRLYAYEEHYFKHADPGENARAILDRGDWIPGVVDPAACGRSQADCRKLIAQYRDLGLELTLADNTVEAGLSTVRELLVNNQLKIFKNLACFWREFRLYRRDERGRVVKENDHLMDCLRYGVMSGRKLMKTKPVKAAPVAESRKYSDRGWMA